MRVCVALLLFVCVIGRRGRPVHTGKEATQSTPSEMLSITGSAWAGLAAPHQQLASFRLRRDRERDSVMVVPAEQLERKARVDVRTGGGWRPLHALYETIMCDVHRPFRVDTSDMTFSDVTDLKRRD